MSMSEQPSLVSLALTQARRLRELHGAPQQIGLSVYGSDDDLRQLRPEDGPEATAAAQRAITEAVATALRADGHPVKLVTLRVVSYLAWLSANDKPNTAANRAAWITEQLQQL